MNGLPAKVAPEEDDKWLTVKKYSTITRTRVTSVSLMMPVMKLAPAWWVRLPVVMRLQIKVNDEGVIEDAKFKTYGCGSAIASSSLLTEWVKGKTLDEAEHIKNTEIAQELALPPVKIHCSVLAEDAIKAAISDYRKKKGA